MAERLHIQPIIIGLTVVAFGTSAPELVICLDAALTGSPDIAVGNVVGSNIANILLVLGVPALIHATDCNQPFIVRNTIYMIGATVIFIALAHSGPFDGGDALALLTLLSLFIYESARRALDGRRAQKAMQLPVEGVEGVPSSLGLAIAFTAGGIVGLPVGAHLAVDSAREIALAWGVSETAIGLTVVALGTSLPELATTVVAAFRKESGIAVGNVIGSNMVNILAITGIVSAVTRIEVSERILSVDIWVMLASALVVVPFVVRRSCISRPTGLVFVLGYAIFVFFALAVDPAAVAVH